MYGGEAKSALGISVNVLQPADDMLGMILHTIATPMLLHKH